MNETDWSWDTWLNTKFNADADAITNKGLYIAFRINNGDSYILKYYSEKNGDNGELDTENPKYILGKNVQVKEEDTFNPGVEDDINKIGFVVDDKQNIKPIIRGSMDIEFDMFKEKLDRRNTLFNFYKYGIYDWLIMEEIDGKGSSSIRSSSNGNGNGNGNNSDNRGSSSSSSSSSSSNSSNDNSGNSSNDNSSNNQLTNTKSISDSIDQIQSSNQSSNQRELNIDQKKMHTDLKEDNIRNIAYRDFDEYRNYIEELNSDPYAVYGGGDLGKNRKDDEYLDIDTMSNDEKTKIFQSFDDFLIKLISIPLNASYWTKELLMVSKPMLFFKFQTYKHIKDGNKKIKSIQDSIKKDYFLRIDENPYIKKDETQQQQQQQQQQPQQQQQQQKQQQDDNIFYSDVPFVIKTYLIHTGNKPIQDTDEKIYIKNMINSWINAYYKNNAIEVLKDVLNDEKLGEQSQYRGQEIKKFWKKNNLLKSVLLINKFNDKQVNPHYIIKTPNERGDFQKIEIEYDYSVKQLKNFNSNSVTRFKKRYGDFALGIRPIIGSNKDKWNENFIKKLKDEEIMNDEKDTFIFGYGSSGSGKTSTLIYDNREIFKEKDNDSGKGLITRYIEKYDGEFTIKIHEIWQERVDENKKKMYKYDEFTIDNNELVLKNLNPKDNNINSFFNLTGIKNNIIDDSLDKKSINRTFNNKDKKYLLYYYIYTKQADIIKANMIDGVVVHDYTLSKLNDKNECPDYPNNIKSPRYFGTYYENRVSKDEFEWQTKHYSSDGFYDNGGEYKHSKCVGFGNYIPPNQIAKNNQLFFLNQERVNNLKHVREEFDNKIEEAGKLSNPWWFIELNKHENDKTLHLFTKMDILIKSIKKLKWNNYQVNPSVDDKSINHYILGNPNHTRTNFIPLETKQIHENLIYIESLLSIDINNYFKEQIKSIQNNSIIAKLQPSILKDASIKRDINSKCSNKLNEFAIFEIISKIMDKMPYYIYKWKHKCRRDYYVFNRMKIFKEWCHNFADNNINYGTNASDYDDYLIPDINIFEQTTNASPALNLDGPVQIDENTKFFRDICIHKYTLMYYLNDSYIKDSSLSINYLNIMKTIFDDNTNINRDFSEAKYQTSFGGNDQNFLYKGPLSNYKNHIGSLVTHTSRFLPNNNKIGVTKTPISLEQYIKRMFTRIDIKNEKRDSKSKDVFDPVASGYNPWNAVGIDTTIPKDTENFYNNNAFDLSSINFFGNYLNENHSELVKFYLYFIDFILLHYSLDHYNFIFEENPETKRFINYTQDKKISTVLWHSVDVDRNINSTMNNPDSSRSHVLYEITTGDGNNTKKKFIGDFAGIENRFDKNSLVTIKEFIRRDYNKRTIPNKEYNLKTSDIDYNEIVIKGLLQDENFQKYMYNKNTYISNKDDFLRIDKSKLSVSVFNNENKLCTIQKPGDLIYKFVQRPDDRKLSTLTNTDVHPGYWHRKNPNTDNYKYAKILKNNGSIPNEEIYITPSSIKKLNQNNDQPTYVIDESKSRTENKTSGIIPVSIIIPYKFSININESNKNVNSEVVVNLVEYYNNIKNKITEVHIQKIIGYYKKIYECITTGNIFKLIDDPDLENDHIVYLVNTSIRNGGSSKNRKSKKYTQFKKQKSNTRKKQYGGDTNYGPIDKYKKDGNKIIQNIQFDDLRIKIDAKQYVIDTVNLFFNTYDYIKDRLVEGEFINTSLIDMVEDVKWVAYFQKQGGKFGTFDVYNRFCEKIDVCYSLKHKTQNSYMIKSDIMKLLLNKNVFDINNVHGSNKEYKLDILDHLNKQDKRYINLNMVAFGVLNVTYDDIKDNPASDPYLDISLFQQQLEIFNDNKLVNCKKNESADDENNANKENASDITTGDFTTGDCTEFNEVKEEFEKLIEPMAELIGEKEDYDNKSLKPIVYYSDAWKVYNEYFNNLNPSIVDLQQFEKDITEINMRTPMGTMDILYNFIHHNSVGYSYTINDENKEENEEVYIPIYQ
jgi:hypothetical protein